MKKELPVLPSGKLLIGKAGSTDLVVSQDPASWVRSALVQELTAAGYDVKEAQSSPGQTARELKTSILELSARQSPNIVTLVTVAEVKLEVQVLKSGQPVTTLTASAQDQEESTVRSPAIIEAALEKTLHRALQELLPDIVKALEQ